MRRGALIAGALAALVASSALGEARFARWRRNVSRSQSDSFAVLLATIGAECDGSTPTFSDGTSLTSTRASIATCTSSAGLVVVLSSGQPRVSSLGVLVEGARGNQAVYSEQWDNGSGWVTASGTVNVTANNCVAPDGTLTGETLNATVVGSSYRSATPSATSANVSETFYVRTTASTQAGRLRLWNNTTSAYICDVDYTATTTWQRVNCSGALTSGNGYQIQVLPGADGTGASCFWGGGQESAAFPSSYIPTAATGVTRAADDVHFTPGQNISVSGCISGTVTFGPVAPASARLIGGATATGIYITDADTVTLSDSTNTVAVDTTTLAGTTTTFRAGWSGSVMSLSIGAVTASGTFDGSMDMGTVYLGSQAGSSNFLYGFLKSVKLGTSSSGCLP